MGSSHDNVCPSTTSGMDYIRNPRLFKGMGKCLIKQTLIVDPIQKLIFPRLFLGRATSVGNSWPLTSKGQDSS